jgi:uncharacterized membrane protein
MSTPPSALRLWLNPLVLVLIGSFVAFGVLGLAGVGPWQDWPGPLRWALAIMFLISAGARLSPMRAGLIAMVPPRLPRPALLVDIAGALEAVGAIGLLWDRTAPAAAICLAVLLVALFPANVYAARSGLPAVRPFAIPLPIRTTQQIVFIAALVVAAF